MLNIKYGDKMIKFVIYHWTDNMIDDNPLSAWQTGVVNLKENKSRGIKPHPKGFKFNSLAELADAHIKCAQWAGIQLHKGATKC